MVKTNSRFPVRLCEVWSLPGLTQRPGDSPGLRAGSSEKQCPQRTAVAEA